MMVLGIIISSEIVSHDFSYQETTAVISYKLRVERSTRDWVGQRVRDIENGRSVSAKLHLDRSKGDYKARQ